MTDPNIKTINYINALTQEKFWGFLTLKFEKGEVVHVRKEENMKPGNLPEKTRSYNGTTTTNNR